MNLAAPNAQTPMSDSTFYMLRCVVAVACADNVIKQEELLFLRALLSHFKRHLAVTAAQVNQLKDDLRDHQPIDALLPHVTDKADREHLILFAGLLAQSDGDVHPAEEALLHKIQAWCAPRPGEAPAAAPPSGSAPAGVSVATVTPNIDMHGFMQEVRDVIKQEVYREALKTSGVSQGTGPVAVIDAFAEKSRIVPHTDSYDVLIEDSKLGKDIRHSLVPEERLLAKAKFHWIYTFYSLLGAGILVGAAAPARHAIDVLAGKARDYLAGDQAQWLGATAVQSLFKLASNPLLVTVPPLLMFVAGILFFLWRALVQYTTEIVITDSRLVVKQGVFRIRTFKTDFQTLGQINVDQSLLGNILGYGTVHIFTRNWEGKGGQLEAEGIYLPPIAHPHSFSTQVDRARRMWRKGQV